MSSETRYSEYKTKVIRNYINTLGLPIDKIKSDRFPVWPVLTKWKENNQVFIIGAYPTADFQGTGNGLFQRAIFMSLLITPPKVVRN